VGQRAGTKVVVRRETTTPNWDINPHIKPAMKLLTNNPTPQWRVLLKK
jgi:hypothetical protein